MTLTPQEAAAMEWASNSSWEAGKVAVLVRLVRRLLEREKVLTDSLMGCRDCNAISDALKWAGLGGLMRSKIMMRLSDIRYRPASLSALNPGEIKP
jgi:hypothetical protein